MPLTDIKNFRLIDERRASAGQPTEAQLGEVAAAGYTAVINLGLLDPKYCLADEAGLVASLGLRYRHIPVLFDAPTLDDFRAFVAVMDEWAAERIFVHCAANYRATSFLALYGELRLGWTREEANEVARSQWQPNEVWLRLLDHCRGELIDGEPYSFRLAAAAWSSGD